LQHHLNTATQMRRVRGSNRKHSRDNRICD
jgi:hypothetical protein